MRGMRAAKAIEVKRGQSYRVIGAKYVVTHLKVGKSRKATGNNLPVGKRTGRDGKKRKLLASYAKMANDDSLRVLADRIQARAVLRMALYARCRGSGRRGSRPGRVGRSDRDPGSSTMSASRGIAEVAFRGREVRV